MSEKFKIGIDYGGTKIEGILLDNLGNEIDRKRVKYNKDYLSSIKTIIKLVKDFEEITKSNCTVGVGIPGFSSKDTGLVNNANALWLNNKPFKKDLESSLNKEIKITEKMIMDSMDDKFEEARYERTIKQNFSSSISNKLSSELTIN